MLFRMCLGGRLLRVRMVRKSNWGSSGYVKTGGCRRSSCRVHAYPGSTLMPLSHFTSNICKPGRKVYLVSLRERQWWTKFSKLGRSLGGLTCPRKGTRKILSFSVSLLLYIFVHELDHLGDASSSKLRDGDLSGYLILHIPLGSIFFIAPRTEQALSWGMGKTIIFLLSFSFFLGMSCLYTKSLRFVHVLTLKHG